MMVSVTPDLKIRPSEVAALEWDHSYGKSVLVIVMRGCATYRIENGFGVDARAIEAELVRAIG